LAASQESADLMKVGVTGHQEFADRSSHEWVESCIRNRLAALDNLTGLSSLAKGTDQLFGTIILDLGGSLEAVLPFPDYEETFENPQDLDCFNHLLAQCTKVTTLPFVTTKEQSYLLAGRHVANGSDIIVAVWNGKPAAGVGGTADIVSYARARNKPVFHINPLTRTALEL
jgi:hypothetical protein